MSEYRVEVEDLATGAVTVVWEGDLHEKGYDAYEQAARQARPYQVVRMMSLYRGARLSVLRSNERVTIEMPDAGPRAEPMVLAQVRRLHPGSAWLGFLAGVLSSAAVLGLARVLGHG